MSRAVNEVEFARDLFVWTEQLCALFLAYGVRPLLRLPVVQNPWALGEVGLVLLVVFSPQRFPSQRDGGSLTPISVELLDHVARTGSRVSFVDHLDKWSSCLVGEPEPRRIACHIKYPKFYQRCAAPDGVASTACVRVGMH
jgi:hypothetical protein